MLMAVLPDTLLPAACSIANPDNLALFPDQQILIIGEDTATHQVGGVLPKTRDPSLTSCSFVVLQTVMKA